MNRPWRVGRKVPRNIYLDDEPIAMLATRGIAANLVGSLNDRWEWRDRAEKAEAAVARLRAALVAIIAETAHGDYDDKIHGLATDALVTTSATNGDDDGG